MKTNVLGIISLTVGIISILLCCLGISVFIGALAALLGLIGVCLPGYKKGLAIAGLICGLSAITIHVMGNYVISELTKDLQTYNNAAIVLQNFFSC